MDKKLIELIDFLKEKGINEDELKPYLQVINAELENGKVYLPSLHQQLK